MKVVPKRVKREGVRERERDRMKGNLGFSRRRKRIQLG